MTLTALRIANFKAFAASQRVPLRPITLIYGANSAGKSSVVHALALAHHSIETGDLDIQRTQIGGESIDLGGFRQYVHRPNQSPRVDLGFELDPGRLSGRVAELLQSAREIVVELEIGMEGREEKVRVEGFTLDVDGVRLLRMNVRTDGLLSLNQLEYSHPVFREFFRALLMTNTIVEEISEEDLVALYKVIYKVVLGITAKSRGLFPRFEEESEGSEMKSEGWENSLPGSREDREEYLAHAAQLFLPKALRDLIEGLGTTLEDEIRRLRYLGPLRSYPPRHLAFSQHHDPNWFAGGGHAWDVVRTREDVRRRVNAWLGDANRLKTPYELKVRDLLPAAVVSEVLSDKLHKAQHDLVASLLEGMKLDEMRDLIQRADQLAEGIAELDPDNQENIIPEIGNIVAAVSDDEVLAEKWTKEMVKMVKERAEDLQDLVLIDKNKKTPVSHRDVGIGISQVLPVLVSAYASENELLAIEQPEIHLHPALQAELGDVFLESALGGAGNTFLIETHSEHLLLRIMRRMRETSTGGLPDRVPEVHPEDVMVLFVEPDGPQSIIREMPLNERGELVKAWPGGFFEEGLREIF